MFLSKTGWNVKLTHCAFLFLSKNNSSSVFTSSLIDTKDISQNIFNITSLLVRRFLGDSIHPCFIPPVTFNLVVIYFNVSFMAGDKQCKNRRSEEEMELQVFRWKSKPLGLLSVSSLSLSFSPSFVSLQTEIIFLQKVEVFLCSFLLHIPHLL